MRIFRPRISLLCLASIVAWSVPIFSESVTLSWDPNSESNLAGYRVYYGTSSRTYGSSIDAGMATTFAVTGLGLGTYYFAVTAYNSSGEESTFSNEVAKAFQPVPGTPKPDPPAITISRPPLITNK
jgi:fibronectin type 3 domain-containing protein